jgi:hypothetical protein
MHPMGACAGRYGEEWRGRSRDTSSSKHSLVAVFQRIASSRMRHRCCIIAHLAYLRYMR